MPFVIGRASSRLTLIPLISQLSNIIPRLFGVSFTMSMYPPRSRAHLRNEPHKPQTLYFAYGSNLSFDQMSKRCPQSRFVGRARLYQYHFQINERGFANVVPTRNPESFVDGLCYRLTIDDEERLDRSEGVPTAYQKQMLDVEFFAATPSLLGRDVTDIVRNRGSSVQSLSPYRGASYADQRKEESYQEWSGGQAQQNTVLKSTAHRRSQSLPGRVEQLGTLNIRVDVTVWDEQPPPAQARGELTKVMVYLSSVYAKDGYPWDEYIERMELGLQEALKLGISETYVQKCVRPYLRTGRGERELQRVHSSRRSRNVSYVKEVPSSSSSRRNRHSRADKQVRTESPDRRVRPHRTVEQEDVMEE
jgi:Gamma-glutamyl cyclotransferase, AIG2-like